MRALQAGIDPTSLGELIRASQQARARAETAIARSGSLGRRAARLSEQSIARRLESRARCAYAVVEGLVEDQPVRAVVRRDGSVDGNRLLLDRARVVVALGDTFDGGRLRASMGVDPLVSVLTLTRACDEARMVRMGRPAPALDLQGG